MWPGCSGREPSARALQPAMASEIGYVRVQRFDEQAQRLYQDPTVQSIARLVAGSPVQFGADLAEILSSHRHPLQEGQAVSLQTHYRRLVGSRWGPDHDEFLKHVTRFYLEATVDDWARRKGVLAELIVFALLRPRYLGAGEWAQENVYVGPVVDGNVETFNETDLDAAGWSTPKQAGEFYSVKFMIGGYFDGDLLGKLERLHSLLAEGEKQIIVGLWSITQTGTQVNQFLRFP